MVTYRNPSIFTDSVGGKRSVGKGDVASGSGVGEFSSVGVGDFKPTKVGVRVKVRVGRTGVAVG
jgi:hypothetical protein